MRNAELVISRRPKGCLGEMRDLIRHGISLRVVVLHTSDGKRALQTVPLTAEEW